MTNRSNSHGAARAPRRPVSGKTPVTGAKLLLTASALAATLGGWAFLTAGEKSVVTAPAQPAQPVTQVEGSQDDAAPIILDLAPLPTLVPLATPHVITMTQLAQPTIVAQPAAAQPVVAAQSSPTPKPTAVPTVRAVLRSVSVPPAPRDSSGGGGGGGQSAPPPAASSRSSR